MSEAGAACRFVVRVGGGVLFLLCTARAPPINLPSVPAPSLAAGATKGASAGLVQAVAWDARAQRLAIALGGSHPATGCVALYDTRCDPILSARFIGFLRLGPLGGGGSGAAGASRAAPVAEPDWEEIRPEEVAEATGAAGTTSAAAQRKTPSSGNGGVVGSGSGVAQALAFLPGFGQGAVLAARCGDQRIAAVPRYFAA